MIKSLLFYYHRKTLSMWFRVKVITSLRMKMTIIGNGLLGYEPNTHDLSCLLWQTKWNLNLKLAQAVYWENYQTATDLVLLLGDSDTDWYRHFPSSSQMHMGSCQQPAAHGGCSDQANATGSSISHVVIPFCVTLANGHPVTYNTVPLSHLAWSELSRVDVRWSKISNTRKEGFGWCIQLKWHVLAPVSRMLGCCSCACRFI